MRAASIIIMVIIILVIIYVIFAAKKTDKCKECPFYDYKDLRDHMQTGDIILFSSKKKTNLRSDIEYYLRTDFLGSEYGHAGIVYRSCDGKLYVIECVSNKHCADKYATYLNKYQKGGIRIIDMEILLHEYTVIDEGLFAVKFISKKIPNEKIIENLKKYEEKIFENKSRLFFLAFIDMCISHNLCQGVSFICDKNKIMCSEFVHSILYDCNVLKEYPSKLFWPFLITNYEIFSRLENIRYSQPYKFLYK